MPTPVPVTTILQGFDTFVGSALSTAVTGTSASPGVSSQAYYRVCTDFESLLNAVNISASASGSYQMVASADAKLEFIKSLNITTYSVSIVVYASKVTDSQAVTDFRFKTPPPQADLNRSFFQPYGDSFVTQIVYGAEYMAAYVFYCESVVEQQSIRGLLAASGVSEDGTFSASLQASIESFKTSVQVRQYSNQQMVGINDVAYPTADGLIEFARTFNTLSVTKPAVISFGTTGYEHVAGCPNLTAIVNSRELFEGRGKQRLGVADALKNLLALQSQTEWIEQVYRTYGYGGDPSVQSKHPQVTLDINTLIDLVNSMSADPTQKYALPQLASLSYGSPTLAFDLRPADGPAGVWGTRSEVGGTSFQDVTRLSILRQAFLSSISAWGNRWLDGLICTYSFANDAPVVVSHGGRGGNPSSTLNLQPGEFLTHLFGYQQIYVYMLVVDTSRNGYWAWPPHSDGGAPIDYHVPAGWAVVGFQGYQGAYVDQLQPMICSFSPAVWTVA